MFIIKSLIIHGLLNLLHGLPWYDCSVLIDLIARIKTFKLTKKPIKDWYFNNYFRLELSNVSELRIVDQFPRSLFPFTGVQWYFVWMLILLV